MVEVETIVLCAVAFLFKMAIEWRVQSVGIKRFIFFFFSFIAYWDVLAQTSI